MVVLFCKKFPQLIVGNLLYRKGKKNEPIINGK